MSISQIRNQKLFDCPDLFFRRGRVLTTTWRWRESCSEEFGILFSRFLPLSTDISDIDNGGVRILGVSPDLPICEDEVPPIYTARFLREDDRLWFDGFRPL